MSNEKTENMAVEKVWSEAYKHGAVRTSTEATELPFLKFSCDNVVLDVGCGDGGYLESLIEKSGIRAFGVDIVPFKHRSFCFVKADAQHLPFREGVFDVVYSLGVIEHLSSTENAISDASRVLRKEGQALFTVPNAYSLHSLVFRPLSQLFGSWKLGLEKSFKRSQLEKMLSQSGFRSIEHTYLPWTIRPNESFVRKLFKRLDNALSSLFGNWAFFLCIYGVK